GWLIAALFLSAISRANQATFFWMQWESIQTFDLIRNITVTPLTLAAWILASRDWSHDATARPLQTLPPRPPQPLSASRRTTSRRWPVQVAVWLPRAVLAAAALIGLATALSRPWFFPGLPPAAAPLIRQALLVLRLLLLLLYLYIALRGLVQEKTD